MNNFMKTYKKSKRKQRKRRFKRIQVSSRLAHDDDPVMEFGNINIEQKIMKLKNVVVDEAQKVNGGTEEVNQGSLGYTKYVKAKRPKNSSKTNLQ